MKRWHCHAQEALHRLCPDYATDINSPLRHVRTRIYFTSESHVHSLMSVLRFCHMGAPHLPPSRNEENHLRHAGARLEQSSEAARSVNVLL